MIAGVCGSEGRDAVVGRGAREGLGVIGCLWGGENL